MTDAPGTLLAAFDEEVLRDERPLLEARARLWALQRGERSSAAHGVGADFVQVPAWLSLDERILAGAPASVSYISEPLQSAEGRSVPIPILDGQIHVKKQPSPSSGALALTAGTIAAASRVSVDSQPARSQVTAAQSQSLARAQEEATAPAAAGNELLPTEPVPTEPSYAYDLTRAQRFAEAGTIDQATLSWRAGPLVERPRDAEPLPWERKKRRRDTVEKPESNTSDSAHDTLSHGDSASLEPSHIAPAKADVLSHGEREPEQARARKSARIAVNPAAWIHPLDEPNATTSLSSAVLHGYQPFELRQPFDYDCVVSAVPQIVPQFVPYIPPSRRTANYRTGAESVADVLPSGATPFLGISGTQLAKWNSEAALADNRSVPANVAKRVAALRWERNSERHQHSEFMLEAVGALARDGPVGGKIDDVALFGNDAFLESLDPVERQLAVHLGTDRAGVTPLLSRRQFTTNWNMVKRDIPRASRRMAQFRSTAMINARKVMMVVLKELKRRVQRSLRITRATNQLQKRSMRECMAFWRKNSKADREMLKQMEKEAEEVRKSQEEEREAQRQKRKLNFLLTQTELFTHFVAGKQGEPGASASSRVTDLSTQSTAAQAIDDADEESLRASAHDAAMRAAERMRSATRALDSDLAELRAANGSEDHVAASEASVTEPVVQLQELEPPKMLNAELKAYQKRGLGWLANLYEQGINGILADEMGLGKTIQSIAFMSWLAEVKGIWGPFLVISPVSTLHNWKHELARFSPRLKILPYWGSVDDRKVIRRFFDPKRLYRKDSPFHVCITSYNLVVRDEQYFRRMKWQYMILDEAQAMKSSSSQRWKTLLGFSCRNRLLLTGTPIQNSMAELWSLLHFIMPTLFDSHAEFSEWFSKGVESHAAGAGKLDAQELQRLHMILKPFMLRRIKTEVEQEIGEKTERTVMCRLSPRQYSLYKSLKDRMSLRDILGGKGRLTASKSTQLSGILQNLVMQFRKVCNHPDLFERSADMISPFFFTELLHQQKPAPGLIPAPPGRGLPIDEIPFVVANQHWSLMDDPAPRLLYELFAELEPTKRFGHACVWAPDALVHGGFQSGTFSFARLSALSPADLTSYGTAQSIDSLRARRTALLWRLQSNIVAPRHMLVISPLVAASRFGLYEGAEPGASDDFTLRAIGTRVYERISPPILTKVICPSMTGARVVSNGPGFLRNAPIPHAACSDARIWHPTFTPEVQALRRYAQQGPWLEVASGVGMPALSNMLAGSGKLAMLDRLLAKLKKEGHRVLIYSQMTKMMDLLEDFLGFRRFRYCRLDGSTSLDDRRDLVNRWQTQDDMFAFLLSTRAGGLGINLTAADTVIFYDSDWNPTMDLQAMDRAHRLGQLKPVTVYRLVTQGTVEERILKRAQMKNAIQKLVIAGNVASLSEADAASIQAADEMTTADMVDLLKDDDEVMLDDTVVDGTPKKKHRRSAW